MEPLSWAEIIGASVALGGVLLGVGRLWIGSEGDKRWAKRSEVMNDRGEPRWATDIERAEKLVLGLSEKASEHESRIIRLEEADRMVIPELTKTMREVRSTMQEIGERLARLEDVPRRLETIEQRLDRRINTRE